MPKPKKATRKGPIATVKHGSVVVPIYRQQTHSGVVYVAQASRDNRKARASLEDAKEVAKEMARTLSDFGSQSLTLSGDDRAEYWAAKDALAPFRISLSSAAKEFAEAKGIVGAGHSLIEAAKAFVATQEPTMAASVLVSDAVGSFLKTKTAMGRSRQHLDDLKYRLERFARAFLMNTSDLRTADVVAWVGRLNQDDRPEPLSGRSRNNYLQAISSFAEYARREGMAPATLDFRKVERFRESTNDVEIFTAAEMRQLLAKCPEDLLPFVVVGAFAGFRSAEITRMEWSQVHLTGDSHFPHGWIELRAGQSKNAAKLGARARRLVPMTAALRAWLEPRRLADEAPLIRWKKPEHHLAKLAEAAGVPWKHNALRHSFGSYRMALTHNEHMVSLEMGNSPAMIFAHYRQLVSPAQAEEWFRISPAPVENVVTLERTA